MEGTEEKQERSRLKDIPEHVKAFIKTQIAYYKLSAIEGISQAAGFVVLGILLLLLFILVIVLLSVSASIAIGYVLDNMALGFLIVGGIYILLAIILVVFRDAIFINPITKAIISKTASSNGSAEENN